LYIPPLKHNTCISAAASPVVSWLRYALYDASPKRYSNGQDAPNCLSKTYRGAEASRWMLRHRDAAGDSKWRGVLPPFERQVALSMQMFGWCRRRSGLNYVSWLKSSSSCIFNWFSFQHLLRTGALCKVYFFYLHLISTCRAYFHPSVWPPVLLHIYV